MKTVAVSGQSAQRYLTVIHCQIVPPIRSHTLTLPFGLQQMVAPGSVPECRDTKRELRLAAIYAPERGRDRFWQYQSFGVPFGNDGYVPRPSGSNRPIPGRSLPRGQTSGSARSRHYPFKYEPRNHMTKRERTLVVGPDRWCNRNLKRYVYRDQRAILEDDDR